MKWANVKLITQREVRDQLRDRRTLFMIAVLPMLLYPLIGMSFLQITQFLKEHATRVKIVGANSLPEEPKLLGEKNFASELILPAEAALFEVVIDNDWAGKPAEEIQRLAKQALESGEFEAIVYFPPNFADKLREFRASASNKPTDPQAAVQKLNAVPSPDIFVDTAKDKSRVAYNRLTAVFDAWRRQIVKQTLSDSKISIEATEPFKLQKVDIAKVDQKHAVIWSKILPFILLVWALTGAFYPAIDLCAGEKERGTLETLLCSPAQRSEIVCGKLLTVMLFSVVTSVLNLLSMGLTGSFIVGQIAKISPTGDFAFGAPPLIASLWLLLALLPISALFSALAMAVAALARSTKEGQYYLMPLLLITMPLMMLPMLPAVELDLGTAIIPVSGVMLLLRTLIEGQYVEAATYALPVIAVTAGCVWLAVRWAVDQFNNESVLFRESERLDLRLWLIHLVRDRGLTPSVGEAILCAILLLLLKFFAGLVLPANYTGFANFASVTLIFMIAFIATPALLMTIMLTRSVRKTLLLRKPVSWLSLPAVVVLAVAIHPIVLVMNQVVSMLYPLSPQALAKVQELTLLIKQGDIWMQLLIVAVTPAICEELAFRGFILSGLRHTGHKWGAIVLSSVFFGVTHAILQQSLLAGLVGVVIGYIAVQTGSIFPCMIYHFAHNGLGVCAGDLLMWLHESESLSWMVTTIDGAPAMYSPAIVAIGGAIAIGLLLWFRKLPYKQTDEEKLQVALDHQPDHSAIATDVPPK